MNNYITVSTVKWALLLLTTHSIWKQCLLDIFVAWKFYTLQCLRVWVCALVCVTCDISNITSWLLGLLLFLQKNVSFKHFSSSTLTYVKCMRNITRGTGATCMWLFRPSLEFAAHPHAAWRPTWHGKSNYSYVCAGSLLLLLALHK